MNGRLLLIHIIISVGILGTFDAMETKEGCKIDLSKLKNKYAPLLTTNGHFLYPSLKNSRGNRITIFSEGSTGQLICHGDKGNSLLFTGEQKSNRTSLQLTCSNGRILSEDKESIDPYKYRCQHLNEPIVSIQRHSNCSLEGADQRNDKLSRITSVTLDWTLNGTLTKQIEFCIDELLQATLWTKHVLHGGSIDLQDTETARIAFKIDEKGKRRFFGRRSRKAIDKSYSKKSQRAMIKHITGQTKISQQFIIDTNRDGSFYLARGHLSPDAGFVTYAEQLGTYFYINSAPQYQSFNNGNWKALEMATRDLAAKGKSDLNITTGTYGILSYFGKKIFLLEGEYIPVPQLFWKVIHHPGSKKAIAFVGSNDVHSKIAPSTLCQDVCDKVPWVDWQRKDISKGYMYCCTTKDLRKAISYAPNLSLPLLTDITLR